MSDTMNDDRALELLRNATAPAAPSGDYASMTADIAAHALPEPIAYAWELNNGCVEFTDDPHCPVSAEEWSTASALFDADQMRAFAAAAIRLHYKFKPATPQPAAAVPDMWTLRFLDTGWLNASTTFKTEKQANAYADRCAIPDVCNRNPTRPEVVPLYAQALASNAGVPEGLRDFLSAKMHHLPVEDQHVLSVFLSAAPSPQESK